MCGIAGIVSLDGMAVPRLDSALHVLDRLIAHRGPDGQGSWTGPSRAAGLVHRRLAIIDLSPAAAQPMLGPGSTAITYNGEIYNYLELREALADRWPFRSASDTECILAATTATAPIASAICAACSRLRSGMSGARPCSARATG